MVDSIVSSDTPPVIEAYDDPIISVKDPVQRIIKGTPQGAKNYVVSLFPFAQWIYRYNLTWLYSDLTAGITVGIVVVPQGMSYAIIAGLEPQYGLYASFIGVLLYCFFATSKDVTIGPVAVMSAETYRVISKVTEKLDLPASSAPMIGSTLALLCGAITAGIGFLRLGFLLDYISMPAVLGFMSGSAFTIAAGQVPALLGINKRLNTRAASYLVVVNTLKNLKHTNLNAAFGLVSLFFLFFFKYFFEYMQKRDPRRKKLYFYLSTLRHAVVIVFSTLIAWGVCRHHTKASGYPISIIKTVPRGLHDVGVHPLNRDIVNALASELPISTVVLLLEHIAISKSFGRINDYRINPNQELVAIGVTNLIAHFFNAYPATGSFSRTALKSKCGVRTPLAGIFTGIVVLVAIYALTDAFYYISNAALSAIIIHAVVDLVSSWRASYGFWKVSPLELVIFLVDILLCVFVSLESGIYFAVAASLVLLLLRISFPSGQFLGKVEYINVNNPKIVTPEVIDVKSASSNSNSQQNSTSASLNDNASISKAAQVETALAPSESIIQTTQKQPPTFVGHTRYKWVPLSRKEINPDVHVIPPPPGVFVYRFTESLTYPNGVRQLDHLVEYIREHTKRDIDHSKEVKLGDRPWNDHGPRHRKFDPTFVDPRPFLRAVVFDLSGTPHIDLTAVTAIWDTQQELRKYANRDVEFHFAGILSPWARRALVQAGFGGGPNDRLVTNHVEAADPDIHQVSIARGDNFDYEAQTQKSGGASYVPLTSTSRPFFHFDIPDLS